MFLFPHLRYPIDVFHITVVQGEGNTTKRLNKVRLNELLYLSIHQTLFLCCEYENDEASYVVLVDEGKWVGSSTAWVG